MADNSLERAIELIQAGKIEAARERLELIIKNDRSNIPAWHWYAQTWPSAKEKARIWQACLRYNPGNEQAQQALKDLNFDPAKQTIPELTRPPIARKAKARASLLWLVGATIGLLATVAVLAWITVKANVPKDPEPYRHVQPYEYYLYVPKAYAPDKELPLFIGFHQFGVECWQLWQIYAEREHFILLCPNFSDDQWYQEVGEPVLWDMISQVKKEYRIQTKMFLVGFSGGAQFAQGFAYNYPQYVSGVSMLSAGSYSDVNLDAKDILFSVVIGDQDHPFSVEQSSLFSQYLAQEGFYVQYKLLPGVGRVVTKEGVSLTIKLFRKTMRK